MLVFIDESGDPGFRLDRGASPIFVAAMVVFGSPDEAAETQMRIEESEARRCHRLEFKFNKCSNNVRDKFFQVARQCPFKIRSIVVQKQFIYSPRLKADKERFYQYFVNMMMKNDNGLLRNARVTIDGSGDREFRRNLNAALGRHRGGAVKDVRFKDSRNDVLVQLADMCAGAIARSYRSDRADGRRWRDMLQPRIDDVWDFV
jgi:hypothetical protein